MAVLFLSAVLLCQFLLPSPALPEDLFAHNIFSSFFTSKQTDHGKTYTTTLNTPEPKSFTAHKPATTFRIFITGGSAAYLLSKRTEYFKQLLTLINKNLDYEIINCGVSGFDSWRTKTAALEIIDKGTPDLLLVLSGNNEIYALGPVLLYSRHIVRQLKKIRLIGHLWQICKPTPDKQQKTPSPRPHATLLANYKNNIGQIIKHATNKNIPVLLCTVPDNIKDTLPAGTPPTNNAYTQSIKAFYSKNYTHALNLCNQYLMSHPEEKFGLFLKASILNKQGKQQQAKKLFEKTLELDYPYKRACRASNQILHTLANDNAKAYLADTGNLFNQLSPNCQLAGAEIFFDECHWYFNFSNAFFQLAANTIAQNNLIPNGVKSKNFVTGNTYSDYLSDNDIFTARTKIRVDPSIATRNFAQILHLYSLSPQKLEDNFSTYQQKNEQDPYRWAFYCLALGKVFLINDNTQKAKHYFAMLEKINFRSPEFEKLKQQF